MTSFDYSLEPNGVLNSPLGGGQPYVLSFGTHTDHGVQTFGLVTDLTIPTAGIYVVELFAPWPYQAGGLRGAGIRLNGVDHTNDERDPDNVNDAQCVTALVAVNAGDKLSARVYQNSQHTLNFVGAYLRASAL